MKINKAKLLVGTLAIASVAATVGSISGTVAWFQYSTRSTVAYEGATAHCSENLQIRLHDENIDAYKDAGASATWGADLSLAQVKAYIKAKRGNVEDYNLRPVTSGNALSAAGTVATTFYKSPIYQYSAAYTTWRTATALDYVELPIELRVLDRNGETADTFLAKKVYLTDLTINSTSTGTKKDITPALRVGFGLTGEGTNSVTFSKNGGSVTTVGALDLNNDGKDDKKEGYLDFNPSLEDFTYGTTGAVEVTTKIEKAEDASGMLANDTNPENIVGKELGSTAADAVLAIKVRIYLEGWQTLGTTPSALWNDDDFVDASFQVGMRFSVPAHVDATE